MTHRAGLTVSFVIPTLNSEAYLPLCLEAIRQQDYPAELIEIVISDGGSTDRTREIAESHGARVVHNERRTAEAGKAVGIAAATGEVLAFVDSDNVIIGNDWLSRMTEPLTSSDVMSSEALRWAYVREDGIVNRYCALTGINDPASLFVGNYGRYSTLTGRWTDYPVEIIEHSGWQEVVLDPARVPTMGANGFLIRAEVMRKVPGIQDYLFDIDAVQQLAGMGYPRVARVDVEVRHFFARNPRDFARKARRRAQDYLHHRSGRDRTYPWGVWGLVRFTIATVLVVPLLLQVAKGLRRRPDLAWFFHPVACWITLAVYAEAVVRAAVGGRAYDRSGWRQ